MGLLDETLSVPASAYGAEPLAVAEIDAHPDAARIWATIRAMREEHDGLCELAYDAGLQDGRGGE
jgi:hypothetical protein